MPVNRTMVHSRFGGARLRMLVLACCVTVLGACAMPPAGDPEAIAEWQATNDPLEPLNRGIFEVNLVVDKAIVRPIASGYRWIFPSFMRNALKNVIDNLGEPLNFANSLLQGEIGRAGTAAGRLLVNSTLGFGGLFDVADTLGLKDATEDFGQTLAVWGTGEIAYLVLPILGPSSVRDGVGRGVDFFLNPINHALDNADLEWVGWTMMAVDGVDQRSRHIETLDEIERTSVDYYAAIRSLYRQMRHDSIHNGEATDDNPFAGDSQPFVDDDELSNVN